MKNENIPLVAVALILLFLAVLCLTGCATKTKTITEFVYSHDTLKISKTDTLTKYVWHERSDSFKEKENNTIVLNENGDTLQKIKYLYKWEKEVIHDTTDTYKSVADSLQSVIDNQKERVVTVVKERGLLEKWLDRLLYMSLAIAIALIVLKGKWIVDRIKSWVVMIISFLI